MIKWTTIQKVESQLLVPASITDLVEAVRALPGKEQRKIVEACGNVEPQETAPTEQVRADICDLQHDRDAAYSKLTKLHAKLISAEARVRQLEEEREQFHDQSLMPEHVSVLLATLNKRSDAARLWKRAAKAYRADYRIDHEARVTLMGECIELCEERDALKTELDEVRREALAPHTWSEADKMREERDAAHSALRTIAEHVRGHVSPECSHGFHLLVANEVRGVVGKLREERDAARDCQAGKQDWFCGRCQACLSRVNGELHNENKSLLREQNSARAELARMRPVVQQACIAYDAGGLLGYSGPGVLSLRRAVEAYRAATDEQIVDGLLRRQPPQRERHVQPVESEPHDVKMVCPTCGETPHRCQPSPDAGPYWRCSECGNAALPSAVCHATGVQECSKCDDEDCGDNLRKKPAPIKTHEPDSRVITYEIPDIQRTYRAPDNDTAERIAADAASESSRPATWVVQRRIEALVEARVRETQRETDAYRKHLRAIASAIGAHITEDEWEEMTPATAERLAAEVDAAQPEPGAPPQPGAPERVLCSPYWERGVAHWDGGTWRADTPDERIIRVCRMAEYLRADLVETRVRAALEAAAERAVEWLDGTAEIGADLRRAVMGEDQ